MLRKRLFHVTNGRVRLLVGLFLVTLFCIQCSPRLHAVQQQEPTVQYVEGKAIGANSRKTLDNVTKWAKDDHIALLKNSLEHYNASIRDYRCTFKKQELLAGGMSEVQQAQVKFLDDPFSVYMEWSVNPKAEKTLYVEGKHDNQMIVLGKLGPFRAQVKRSPEDPEAMKYTLRPVTMFGFRRGLENLISVYEQAKAAGDLKQSVKKDVAKLADGREAIVLVRELPAKDDYPAAVTEIYIDLESLMPVQVRNYGWRGELLSWYSFENIQFNVNLKEDDFLPDANGLK